MWRTTKRTYGCVDLTQPPHAMDDETKAARDYLAGLNAPEINEILPTMDNASLRLWAGFLKGKLGESS